MKHLSSKVKSVSLVEAGIALRTDRLKTLREQHGWSQRELSRLCNFGETQIGKYESGQNDPSSTHLTILADKLGVSVDYLVGFSDDPRGQIGGGDLTDEERILVDKFRRDGWSGVIHLGADRLANPNSP